MSNILFSGGAEVLYPRQKSDFEKTKYVTFEEDKQLPIPFYSEGYLTKLFYPPIS